MNQFTLAEEALANKLAFSLIAASENCDDVERLASQSAARALKPEAEQDVLPFFLPQAYIARMLSHYVPQYASPEDLPAAIKAVAGYAAEIACNKLEASE